MAQSVAAGSSDAPEADPPMEHVQDLPSDQEPASTDPAPLPPLPVHPEDWNAMEAILAFCSWLVTMPDKTVIGGGVLTPGLVARVGVFAELYKLPDARDGWDAGLQEHTAVDVTRVEVVVGGPQRTRRM